jgi:polyhydroxybutyrate depolymerase
MDTRPLVRSAGLILLCCVAFVSGASPSSPQQTINALVATTGCGHPSPITPGSSDSQTIAADPTTAEGSQVRTYRMYIPAMYQPQQRLPVVLVFHGYGSSSDEIEALAGFSLLAQHQHFIAVYPDGLTDGLQGAPFWANAGPTGSDGIDDLQFVSDVLNDVQQKVCVDAHRIYATGFSNGGGMTAFLACRLARRIAAFAPISGNMLAPPGGCHPGRPVPLLEIHSVADPVVPYPGDPSSHLHPPGPLLAIPDWLQQWAVRDRCTHGPDPFVKTVSLFAEQWTGCQGHVAVVHYRNEDGNHTWPDLLGDETGAAVIWTFFQTYSLP